MLNNYGNINFTVDNSKHAREYESDSDSSILSCEVKIRRKNCYLFDKGKHDWSPRQELPVNDVNVTTALKKFRSRAMREAENGNEIDSLRILSLSQISPINRFDRHRCIGKYIRKKEAAELIKLGEEFTTTLPRSPKEAVLYCKNIIDDICVDNYDVSEDKEGMMEHIKEISRGIITSTARIADSSEASFTEKHIMPAIRKIILDRSPDNIIYAVIDNPDHDNKKPDIMIGTEHKREDLYFFYVEIKRPAVHSRHQIEDDYVKLLKEMKDSIDGQLKVGIENSSSLRLLVEGFSCTLYKMNLLVDGVYTPILIKRFSLVEGVFDIMSLPTIVEVLSFVKVELFKFVEAVEEKKKKGVKKMMKERICPSFHSGFCK